MRITLAVAVACLTFGLAAAGDATAAIRKSTDIPAQGLGPALTRLAKEFDFQVLYRTEIVSNLKSQPVVGALTSDEALGIVLTGTGLTFKYLDDKTVTIVPLSTADSGQLTPAKASASSDATNTSKEAGKKTSQDFRLAQVDQNVVGTQAVDNQNSGKKKEQGLAEIIVTSDKVSEPLNKAPESIGVLTASSLDSQHAVDMQDVVNRIPGLSSTSGSAPGMSEFAIRGISPGGGTETTVGTYIDDVSINVGNLGSQGGAYEPSFFDLDRIEVLRGPQGTLYGADSFAGTIRYVNKQPQFNVFTGDVQSDIYGQAKGDPGGSVRGAVNLPLMDNALALRLAGIYQYDGGFIDHVDPAGAVVQRNSNTQKVSGGRAILLWQPTESLKVTPTFQYTTTTNADSWFYDSNLGQYNTPRVLDEPLRDQFRFNEVNVKWDFGSSSLTSVSSYVDRDLRNIQDFTLYDTGYIAPVVAAFFDPSNVHGSLQALSDIPTSAFRRDRNQRWAQEVRLDTRFDNAGLRTLLGLYFDHEVRYYNYQEDAAGFGAETTHLFGVGTNQALTEAFGVPPGVADLGDTIYEAIGDARINREAAYFEASWTPPYDQFHDLTLTVGYRVSKITYHSTGIGDGFFAGGYGQGGNNFDENQVAPKFRLSYQATDSTLLYVSATKGFRLGGANGPLPSSCASEVTSSGTTPADSYKTDSIWSYEAGAKVGLLDRTVQLNASAFHIDWTKIAEPIVFPICGFSFNANVGNATSNGGDISLQWRPIAGLDIELGVAYTDARFSSTISQDGVFRGSPVPFSPPWTATADAGYTWPILAGNGYVRANYTYTDTSHGNLLVSQGNFIRPSYETVGASGGYQRGKWDASVYVKNLTDAHPPLDQQIIVGYNNISTLRPRQIGVEVKYAF